MIKKKILVLMGLISISTITAYALSSDFKLDTSKLSAAFSGKKENVINNFNKDYNLSYSISSENSELEEEIKNLTKKTTYLLFGDFNNTNESSENYYKRHKDWLDLRYNPEVPKVPVDENNPLGLDTSSQEYLDDLVSGLAIPQIFNQANEMGLIYNSYGDIRVTINDNLIISSITLPNVKIKEQSKSDPMQYDYIETNYVMYYYFKKLDDKWKLYYLYGESTDEVNEYFNEIETNEENGKMAIAPSYESKLSTVYSFAKLESMTEEELNNIYDSNINNVVYLNSYYNNKVVASANGFFINNGLVLTTWNFVEKSLVDAQYIAVKDSNLNVLEIDGIVTANPDADVAIIKLKKANASSVKLGDGKALKVEDPVVTISSKSSTGALVQTGIVISNEDYIQTSIPLLNADEGSPLLNQKGEVVGINTSKSTSASVSIAINSKALQEIQDKFSNINFNDIDFISFEDLKEKYYYTKYNDENIINNIPKSKWKEYSKIGDVTHTINLELIKASYKDNIISLRYKNNISKYIDSMQLSIDFREKLVKDGYELVTDSKSKAVYQNDKYQVIIMDEFDYLIIVMVKL